MSCCLNCGTEFTKVHFRQVHCSKRCKHVYAQRRYRERNQDAINARQKQWRIDNPQMYREQRLREKQHVIPAKDRIEKAKEDIHAVAGLPWQERVALAEELLHDRSVTYFSSYVEDFISETLEPEFH